MAKIKDAIARYGLTSADLGSSGSAKQALKVQKPGKPGRKPPRQAAGVAPISKSTRPAKFTDGKGRMWGGMGKRPDWFKAALAAGKTPEEMLIKG